MRFPFGQEVPYPAPVREILEKVKFIPMPEEQEFAERDLRELPGGVSNVTHGEGVRRGVGYAVGFKNIGFSAGFDDYSTARVVLSVEDGEPLGRGHTAGAAARPRARPVRGPCGRGPRPRPPSSASGASQ